MDTPREYTRIDGDALSGLPAERRKDLLAFRTLLVEQLRQLLMLLHTLQPIRPGEEVAIKCVSECGFDADLLIQMNAYGSCPLDATQKEMLIATALTRLLETKGMAMHDLPGYESLEDLDARRPEMRNKRQETREQAKRRAQAKALKKESPPSPESKHGESIDSLISDVLQRRKDRRVQPPADPNALPPPPKQDLGFI